jgi:hypothetical protein
MAKKRRRRSRRYNPDGTLKTLVGGVVAIKLIGMMK